MDNASQQTVEIDYTQKLELLKKALLPASSALIVTHDYPDPDCLASAFGMHELLRTWNFKNIAITFGGFVGRAENRAMIRYFNIPIVPFVLIDQSDFEKIILLDASPNAGNVSLKPSSKLAAVFDHHIVLDKYEKNYFSDIRPDLGATSTLITQYLLAAGLSLKAQLATALFYGIKTDTAGMGRDASAEDYRCYKMLFNLMDHQLLYSIENPDRETEFFKIFYRCIESFLYFGDIGFVDLGSIITPDILAEMADTFLCLNTIKWIICCGFFKKGIYFSIRSKDACGAGDKAAEISKALGGSGGGHWKSGAGHIPINESSPECVHQQFVATFKKVFRIHEQEPLRLLTK